MIRFEHVTKVFGGRKKVLDIMDDYGKIGEYCADVTD